MWTIISPSLRRVVISNDKVLSLTSQSQDQITSSVVNLLLFQRNIKMIWHFWHFSRHQQTVKWWVDSLQWDKETDDSHLKASKSGLIQCLLCECSTLEESLKAHIQYNHMISKDQILTVRQENHCKQRLTFLSGPVRPALPSPRPSRAGRDVGHLRGGEEQQHQVSQTVAFQSLYGE